MGTRFIHKNGKAIPIHSDHGDQPDSSGQHAAPMNPPKTPAPTAPEHNHPAATIAVHTAVGGAVAGPLGAIGGAAGGVAHAAGEAYRKSKKSSSSV